MPDSFELVAKSEVTESLSVSVPETTWRGTSLKDARYVRVTRTDNRQSGVYKVALRASATGNQIWIASKQLGLQLKQSSAVTVTAASKSAHICNQLVSTGWGRLTLLGLALALLGIGIDAAFDIGKFKVVFPTADETAATARFVAYILKALGVLILFLQATWFKKE